MKREDLEKLGLTEEVLKAAGLDPKAVIDGIMAIHGRDIETHKSSVATIQEQLDAAKEQLTQANTTIDGLKQMNPEQLKQAAADWEAKAKQFEADAKKALEDAESRVAEVQFMTDLREQLKETYKVKDPSDIVPHLDRSKITRSDKGEFIGLKEQIEPLQQAKEYMFNSETEDPRIVSKGKSTSVITDSVLQEARRAAGLPVEN